MKALCIILLAAMPFCINAQNADSIPYAKADAFILKDTVLCLYLTDSLGHTNTGYFFRKVEGQNYWVPDGKNPNSANKQPIYTLIQYFREDKEFPKENIAYDYGKIKYKK